MKKNNRLMIKSISRSLVMIGVLICVLVGSGKIAEAKTVLMPTTEVYVSGSEYITYTFTMSKPQYIQAVVTEEWSYVFDEDDFPYWKMNENIFSDNEADDTTVICPWYKKDNISKAVVSTETLFHPGTLTFAIDNRTGTDVKVTFAIYGFDSCSTSLKFNNVRKMKSGKPYKIGVLKGNPNEQMPLIIDVKSSYKNMIDPDEWMWDPNGNVYVCPKKPGKGTLSFRLRNKKKLKKTFEILPPDPDFESSIVSYNTRNNYFSIRFENYGIGDLKISSGAKMINFDYKSYDRSVRCGGLTIKPGKSKTVKFYVNGSHTYPDEERFRMDFTFSYYGKRYSARAYIGGSEYKKGKKWVDTCA